MIINLNDEEIKILRAYMENKIQQFAKITDGKLEISSIQEKDYKPIMYAEIPEFDQTTSFITQIAPIDNGKEIYLGIKIETMVVDKEINERVKN